VDGDPVSGEAAFTGPTPLRGRLQVPGDKSISHRALIFAACARGTSRAVGLARGHDVAATRRAVESLGVRCTDEAGAVVVAGEGFAGLREPDDVIDCGNSGTSIRLLAGLLAARPLLAVLTGDESLRCRPMDRVVGPLRAMGSVVDGRDGGRYAPLAIRGASLVAVDHDLPVASAQVKSALVLAGLQAEGTTRVREPAPSRDHTERMLAALGAPVRASASGLEIDAGEPSPFDLEVPADPSSAAFFAVAAAVVAGSDVVLDNVALNPGRIAFVDVLRRMGADIEVRQQHVRLGEPVGEIAVRSGPLRGTEVDGDEIPSVLDEIPALAVAAAAAEGDTEFRDAAELRVKESDRIETTAAMLTALGVEVETRSDGFTVHGGTLRPGVVSSGGDHRIAMAAAVAAWAAEGTTRILDWDCVATSYPEFAEHAASLSGRRG
jgi:3-phosphoshikimate 1-carboxyvinyltransferase